MAAEVVLEVVSISLRVPTLEQDTSLSLTQGDGRWQLNCNIWKKGVPKTLAAPLTQFELNEICHLKDPGQYEMPNFPLRISRRLESGASIMSFLFLDVDKGTKISIHSIDLERALKYLIQPKKRWEKDSQTLRIVL